MNYRSLPNVVHETNLYSAPKIARYWEPLPIVSELLSIEEIQDLTA